jgi:hypothetical protein
LEGRARPWSGRGAVRSSLLVCALIGSWAPVGFAESGLQAHEAQQQSFESAPAPEAKPTPSPEQAADPKGLGEPDIELDLLLKLPSNLEFERERRRGATADDWRSRFKLSRADIETAKRELREARTKLDSLAEGGSGTQWQMAPPGSNQTEASPMSFKLREDIRRGKDNVLDAERKQRALIIEADLASVPESWRHGT